MTTISELGRKHDPSLAFRIHNREDLARRLEKMVMTMKEAVAMDIHIGPVTGKCNVSIYHPNNTSLTAARKERLRLSAISTPARGDSVWWGNETYEALYEHGERTEFEFHVADYMALVDTFVTDLGLSILRNAHSVQYLSLHIEDPIGALLRFVKKFFSLDAWKEAFPSIQRVDLDYACAGGCARSWGSWIFLRIY